MTKLTGIFGATFNPPTQGHENVVRQALDICTRIILVPCISHAFFKRPLPFETRLEMCRVFARELSVRFPEANIDVSDIEKSLYSREPNRPVYTYTVMEAMQSRFADIHPETGLCFIRGPDNAVPSIWKQFYRYRDIEKRWKIFTAEQEIPVRSSYIRDILAGDHKKEEKKAMLSECLTPDVSKYIFENDLYFHPHS